MSWQSTWGNKLNPYLPKEEITNSITHKGVDFAKDFGEYLAKSDRREKALTTSQLRKFFGDVKRQQLKGYEESSFVLLKPKLAYAVGRVKQKKDEYNKIRDFAEVISNAIDVVVKSGNHCKSFDNFMDLFEAIVAYHKSATVEED